MTDPGVKAKIAERMEKMAIPPAAIARAIVFAIAGLLGSQQQSGQVSNGATAHQPRFPPTRRPYSVDEIGGVPLSMKV